MNKGEIKTISQVWEIIDQGKTIYWSGDAYEVVVQPDHQPERTQSHEPRRLIERNGELLEVRCMSNWFGSILHESELGSLYTKD